MNEPEPRPAVWRALGLAAVALLLIAIGMISLISSGRLDPQPAGPLQAEFAVDDLTVGPGDAERFAWLPDLTLPPVPYSLRISAESAGALTVEYGLAIGEPGNYLAITLSPVGYAGVTLESGGESTALFPYQPVAHVPYGSTANELQIDVDVDEIIVWTNREVLWRGAAPFPGAEVAVFARSDAGSTTVRFEPLQLFAPNSP